MRSPAASARVLGRLPLAVPVTAPVRVVTEGVAVQVKAPLAAMPVATCPAAQSAGSAARAVAVSTTLFESVSYVAAAISPEPLELGGLGGIAHNSEPLRISNIDIVYNSLFIPSS
jgi:hypothetical protein